MTKAVLERTGLDPAWIEDVTFAQSYANSETPCVGRWIALEAGLPIEVPGLQIDRRCGGGLQAIATAAMMVQTGACDVVIAEGVESMSRIEFYTTDMRWGRRSGTTQLYDRLDRGRERSQPVERFGHISGMIETAERSRANMRCRGRRRISSPAKATGARGGHGMKGHRQLKGTLSRRTADFSERRGQAVAPVLEISRQTAKARSREARRKSAVTDSG